MKKVIYSALVGSLALAVSVQAADNNGGSKRGKGGRNAATPQSATVKTHNSAQANAHRNSNSAHLQQRSFNTTRNNGAVNHQKRFQDSNVAVSKQRNFDKSRVRHNGANSSESNLAVNRTRNGSVNRQQNNQRNLTVNRQRNVVVTNNWRGSSFSGQQYGAFRNYHRQWHDRDWYNNNHFQIVFFGGGGYYFNQGYWYPAWGYNSGYNYPYDGPIYGYNSLRPDQVVINVQAQLQRDGYYAGQVDGSLGPQTRRAIAAFQADHGLAVTAAVDQPTLSTLGLV